MAGGRHSKAQRVDHGGDFRQLPVSVLDSVAWNCLTLRARCLLLALLRRFNGFNNGSIAASARDLADAVGSHRYSANRAALGELVETGLIAIERTHPRGSRMATEYRLTFIESGSEGRRAPPTHEWRTAQSRNKWKKSPDETNTRKWKRVGGASNDRKRRVDGAFTEATETSHFRPPSPVDGASTHIVSHSQDCAGSPGVIPFPLSKNHESAASPFAGSATPSCGMELSELRDFALGYLTQAEVGAQTKLAADTSIPGGTLSKFLSGRGLAVEHRLKLQIAIGRVWPLELRKASA